MNVYESAEDYLETILVLSKTRKTIRAINIANEMGFSKPSVSIAMRKLEDAGYLKSDDHFRITLTPEGQQIAEKVYARHVAICDILEKIGVSHDIAVKEACKIEHDISDETYECIIRAIAESNQK